MVKEYESIDQYRTAVDYRLGHGFSDTLHFTHRTYFSYEDINGIRVYPDWWASYYHSPLPGCCGVTVMHNFALNENIQQDVNLEDYFQKEREKLCKDSGYSCILATMLDSDPGQLKVYLDSGFKKVHSFVNKRTNKLVHILVKDI